MEKLGEEGRRLLTASNASNLREALESLIITSRTFEGRSELASLGIVPATLDLIRSLPPDPDAGLLLSLRLLRNLCAGDPTNQDAFVSQNGVAIVSEIIAGEREEDGGRIVRAGLQVLGNVSLGGERHRKAVWEGLFPRGFAAVSRVRRTDCCDPLCMVVYSCVDGVPGLVHQLCGDSGSPLLGNILTTLSLVGFEEDWAKLLISRVFLEEDHFPGLFSSLYGCSSSSDVGEWVDLTRDEFLPEQSYLLRIVSEILNARIMEIVVSEEFAQCVLGIFRRSVVVIDSVCGGKSGLPTGITTIDVLGYSLAILRDICAQDVKANFKDEDRVDVVDALLAFGLVELLLSLLGDLEPPSTIRKAMSQGENNKASGSSCPKVCPYKGFRRDIVGIIGNCAYRRKKVQDEIREKNGILLLLQQCVIDEDNPFLREWGLWSMRNLLEENQENQQAVAELELQETVDVPELAGLNLKVEIDRLTRRAKLVNVSASGTLIGDLQYR